MPSHTPLFVCVWMHACAHMNTQMCMCALQVWRSDVRPQIIYQAVRWSLGLHILGGLCQHGLISRFGEVLTDQKCGNRIKHEVEIREVCGYVFLYFHPALFVNLLVCLSFFFFCLIWKSLQHCKKNMHHFCSNTKSFSLIISVKIIFF